MDLWIDVVGVIVILFIISRKGILGLLYRSDREKELKSKPDGRDLFYAWQHKRA